MSPGMRAGRAEDALRTFRMRMGPTPATVRRDALTPLLFI